MVIGSRWEVREALGRRLVLRERAGKREWSRSEENTGLLRALVVNDIKVMCHIEGLKPCDDDEVHAGLPPRELGKGKGRTRGRRLVYIYIYILKGFVVRRVVSQCS